jgi:trehalose synthase
MHEETLRGDRALEQFINSWIRHYDGVIFSAAHYIISHWPFPKFVISPFIDPLSEKNRELRQQEIEAVLEQHGIEPKIPVVSQIGRFDPWKGLTRTIETYRLVRKSVKCQLVLAGGPEGEEILSEICQKVKDDPDVHILNLPPTSSLEINAIQRASQVILQPSIREGFGLTVTEALWKGKPVIGSPVGGILLQLRDGEHGYFYHNPKDSAKRVIYLLTHPRVADVMGKRGTDYVRQHFLLPDRLADYLKAILMVTQMKPDPESIISFHSQHNPDRWM